MIRINKINSHYPRDITELNTFNNENLGLKFCNPYLLKWTIEIEDPYKNIVEFEISPHQTQRIGKYLLSKHWEGFTLCPRDSSPSVIILPIDNQLGFRFETTRSTPRIEIEWSPSDPEDTGKKLNDIAKECYASRVYPDEPHEDLSGWINSLLS